MAPPRRKRAASSEDDDDDEESSNSSESESGSSSNNSGSSEESSSSESSSEEEAVIKPAARGRKPAAAKKPAPAAKKSAPAKKPATAAAKKKGATAAKKKTVAKSDSEDELDASPSKSAMSVVDIEDPGYGSDLVKNEEDGRYLKSLSEMERESVLSERYERRQHWKEMLQIRGIQPQQPSSAKRAPAKKKMIMAADDSDESEAEQKRGKKKPAAAVVAAPKPAQVQVVAQPMESSSSSSSSESDSGDESSSEDERDAYSRSRAKREEEDMDEEDLPQDYHEPISYKWASKVTLTRQQILQWMDFPKFKSGLNGCLIKVRVADGDAIGSGGGQYALMRVEQIMLTDEPYFVDKERVLFMFRVQGQNKRQGVSLARVSNKPLAMEEYGAWRAMPPLANMLNSDAYRALRNLNAKLVNVVFTNKEVLLKVEAGKVRRGESSALTSIRLGVNPVEKKRLISKELAALDQARARLTQEMNSGDADMDDILAQLRQNSEHKARLEQELANTERQILQHARRVYQNDPATKLNAANAERNAQALLEDNADSAGNAATRAAAASTSRFVRRPTRPQVMWDVPGKKAGESSSSSSAEQTATATTTTTTTAQQVVATQSFQETQPEGEEEEEGGLRGSEEAVMQQQRDGSVVSTASLVKPTQVFLRIKPGSSIARSMANKRYTLQEYLEMKHANRRW